MGAGGGLMGGRGGGEGAREVGVGARSGEGILMVGTGLSNMGPLCGCNFKS